jgi:hypothetical protein
VLHYLGSDIRGKPRAELAWGKRADAEIVGSWDAHRWVPEAHVVPPGIDLERYEAAPPPDNERVRVAHAPSNRAKKGTDAVIAACQELRIELDLIEGVKHDEAYRRYAEADVIVDQLRRADRAGVRRAGADRERDEGHARGEASAGRRVRPATAGAR